MGSVKHGSNQLMCLWGKIFATGCFVKSFWCFQKVLKILERAIARLPRWFRPCGETSIMLVAKRLYTAQQSSVGMSQ